ncbi:hypothetical protein TVAG_246940 [Trichomonas vaginalis G3]|uniref:DUF3447 domain-containing protein n=1 Tax=Trichomonas vaginalis (strain ATCC PRA-98 / G3) TaxID=412133 RepID=A2DKN2_TRIV3|nr:spectrin binding [Trichomonas vaginalis G3]EAY19015.1 hypothetical protein TVAG_246940 [Trichomonas vaginalis G3]KAI5521192.1 spectrin binding [Trichomonas vaginalis G3]|eukprot:XP_001580001.1 hypothetical protein [Trichomonas vaginalis G3]
MEELYRPLTDDLSKIEEFSKQLLHIGPESIQNVCSFMMELIDKKILSVNNAIHALDVFSERRPHNLKYYGEVFAFITSQTRFANITKHIKFRTRIFTALLVDKGLLPGWAPPIEYNGWSNEEILQIYSNGYFRSIFNDDLDKLIDDLENCAPNDSRFTVIDILLDFAAKCGSDKIFKYLYSIGANSTEKTLHKAFCGNNLEIINILEQKHKISQKCIDNAVKYHHNDLVVYLMTKYNLNYDYQICFSNFVSENPNSMSCFDLAVNTFLSPFVSYLIDKKLTQSIKTINAPMLFFRHEINMAKLLIDNGIIPEDAFQLCCQSNSVEIAKILVENGHKFEDKYLFDCISCRSYEMACFLIDQGTDVNTIANGQPVICAALKFNHFEFFKLLLDHHAKIDFFVSKTTPFLNYVVSSAPFEYVCCLLQDRNNKINLETRDKDGTTPFIASCIRGDINIVKLLIKKGCDLNAVNKNNQSGLIIATKKKFIDICALLVENHCDKSIQTKFGETAQSIAEKYKNSDLLNILKE